MFNEILKITPGNIVPNDLLVVKNARYVGSSTQLLDSNGNVISGRSVSNGDDIAVVDVGYSGQLALVQYPAGGYTRQGYIRNSQNIRYYEQANWHNGSTVEIVYDYNGGRLGSLNPYETATQLYQLDGRYHVVYNTDKGSNTKSGFVRYAGSSPHRVNIPQPAISNAQKIVYGTSGKGRSLTAYKVGHGSNSLILVCAIHGWEDHWNADGIELTKIGNGVIEHFQQNSTGDFSLYIIPAANPDGLAEGFTNDGAGRCSVVGGVDCNRDFPIGFTPFGNPRNYTGAHPLSVPESRELKNFIQKTKNETSGKTYVIDMHGWEGSVIGRSQIADHFIKEFGSRRLDGFGAPRGFLSQWADSIGTIAALVELPRNTYSPQDAINGQYKQKAIRAISGLIGSKLTGWIDRDGYTFYYDSNGQPLIGKQRISGYLHYFDKNGAMYKGDFSINGEAYYTDKNGAIFVGWYGRNGYTFYSNSEGVIQKGIQNIENKTYIFDKNGAMYKNVEIHGYRVDENGVATKIGGHWIEDGYVNEDGVRLKYWQFIEDYWRYFGSNGIVTRGSGLIDGQVYEFDKNGAAYLGWRNFDGAIYFTEDGPSRPYNATGWRLIDEYWRYFDLSTAKAFVGTHTIEGIEYTFDKNGALYGDKDEISNTLSYGSKGKAVEDLQSKLQYIGYTLNVDGVFGKETENIVKIFQSTHGLIVDGIVGQQTKSKLDEVVKNHESGNGNEEEYHENSEYHRVLKIMKPFLRGNDVKRVQTKLNELGYNVGSVDGIYGNITSNKILEYQSDKNLVMDGMVGIITWDKLINNISDNTTGEYDNNSSYHRVLRYMTPLMTGADVKKVQVRLKNLGYKIENIDSIYGSITTNEVKNFQKNNYLSVDGAVGENTWKKLDLDNPSVIGALALGKTSKQTKTYKDPNLILENILGQIPINTNIFIYEEVLNSYKVYYNGEYCYISSLDLVYIKEPTMAHKSVLEQALEKTFKPNDESIMQLDSSQLFPKLATTFYLYDSHHKFIDSRKRTRIERRFNSVAFYDLNNNCTSYMSLEAAQMLIPPDYNPFTDHLKFSEMKKLLKDFLLYIGVGITVINDAIEYLSNQIRNNNPIDWKYFATRIISNSVLNVIASIGFTALGNAIGAFVAAFFGGSVLAGTLLGVLVGTGLSIVLADLSENIIEMFIEFIYGMFKNIEEFFSNNYSLA